MASEYMTTRAHDFTEALTTALPQMQFQAYLARDVQADSTDLYLFGFITSEVLIGDYGITAHHVEHDFIHPLMNAPPFFRKAWQEKVPQFHPTQGQVLYEQHREGNFHLQRVA